MILGFKKVDRGISKINHLKTNNHEMFLQSQICNQKSRGKGMDEGEASTFIM